MKNLEISDKIKEVFGKGKAKIKRVALTTGVLVGLATTVLTGCRNRTGDDYSFKSVYEVLDEKYNMDSKAELDDKKVSVQKLDQMLTEAYDNKDEYTCNRIIQALSENVLKNLAAEGFKIDIDDIKDFEVLGRISYEGLDSLRTDGYGISFKYKDQTYNMEAKGDSDDLGFIVCKIYRAAMQDELTLTKPSTDEYLEIPNAYDYLKEALMSKMVTKDDQHESQNQEYDGYFELEEDHNKVKLLDDNGAVKEFDFKGSAEKETTRENNLPVK